MRMALMMRLIVAVLEIPQVVLRFAIAVGSACTSVRVPVECSASSPSGRYAPIQYAAATEGNAAAYVICFGFL